MPFWDAPRGTLYENKKRLIQEMGRYLCVNKQWRVIDYCFNSSIVDLVNFMHPVLSQVSVELKYMSENFKNDQVKKLVPNNDIAESKL